MSFTIQQSKKKGIKQRLSFAFFDSVHFLNNSLDNLDKNLGENDFYCLSQEFNANELALLKNNRFFSVTTAIALKKSKKAYVVKISFIIH